MSSSIPVVSVLAQWRSDFAMQHGRAPGPTDMHAHMTALATAGAPQELSDFRAAVKAAAEAAKARSLSVPAFPTVATVASVAPPPASAMLSHRVPLAVLQETRADAVSGSLHAGPSSCAALAPAPRASLPSMRTAAAQLQHGEPEPPRKPVASVAKPSSSVAVSGPISSDSAASAPPPPAQPHTYSHTHTGVPPRVRSSAANNADNFVVSDYRGKSSKPLMLAKLRRAALVRSHLKARSAAAHTHTHAQHADEGEGELADALMSDEEVASTPAADVRVATVAVAPAPDSVQGYADFTGLDARIDARLNVSRQRHAEKTQERATAGAHAFDADVVELCLESLAELDAVLCRAPAAEPAAPPAVPASEASASEAHGTVLLYSSSSEDENVDRSQPIKRPRPAAVSHRTVSVDKLVKETARTDVQRIRSVVATTAVKAGVCASGFGPHGRPLCSGHNVESVQRRVKKRGPNKGRYFYCCPYAQDLRCNFFVWKDADARAALEKFLVEYSASMDSDAAVRLSREHARRASLKRWSDKALTVLQLRDEVKRRGAHQIAETQLTAILQVARHLDASQRVRKARAKPASAAATAPRGKPTELAGVAIPNPPREVPDTEAHADSSTSSTSDSDSASSSSSSDSSTSSASSDSESSSTSSSSSSRTTASSPDSDDSSISSTVSEECRPARTGKRPRARAPAPRARQPPADMQSKQPFRPLHSLRRQELIALLVYSDETSAAAWSAAPSPASNPAAQAQPRRQRRAFDSLSDLLQEVFGHAGFRGDSKIVCASCLHVCDGDHDSAATCAVTGARHAVRSMTLQEWSVRSTLLGRSVLSVAATGTGKSLCYQLPALLSSGRASVADTPCVLHGIVIVVSPLVALIRDQMLRLPAALSAIYLAGRDSQSNDDVLAALHGLREGRTQIMFLSPERLFSRSFIRLARSHLMPPVACVCVDEAHVMTEWSHNFRPAYLRLADVIASTLRPQCVLGLTATAVQRVVASLQDTLHIPPSATWCAPWQRTNLTYSCSRDENRHDALLKFFQHLREAAAEAPTARRKPKSSSGATDSVTTQRSTVVPCTLVYVSTQADADSLATFLNSSGVSAAAYHAGLPTATRERVYTRFMRGTVRVVVCTTAFGMGLDKADIRSVVHFHIPRSWEDFVQQTGRAGRDGAASICHVFVSPDDADVQRLLATTAADTVDVEQVRGLLQGIQGLAVQVLQLQKGAADGTAFRDAHASMLAGDEYVSHSQAAMDPREVVEIVIPFAWSRMHWDLRDETVETLLLRLMSNSEAGQLEVGLSRACAVSITLLSSEEPSALDRRPSSGTAALADDIVHSALLMVRARRHRLQEAWLTPAPSLTVDDRGRKVIHAGLDELAAFICSRAADVFATLPERGAGNAPHLPQLHLANTAALLRGLMELQSNKRVLVQVTSWGLGIRMKPVWTPEHVADAAHSLSEHMDAAARLAFQRINSVRSTLLDAAAPTWVAALDEEQRAARHVLIQNAVHTYMSAHTPSTSDAVEDIPRALLGSILQAARNVLSRMAELVHERFHSRGGKDRYDGTQRTEMLTGAPALVTPSALARVLLGVSSPAFGPTDFAAMWNNAANGWSSSGTWARCVCMPTASSTASTYTPSFWALRALCQRVLTLATRVRPAPADA